MPQAAWRGVSPPRAHRGGGGKVSDASDATHFSVTYTDDEIRSYGRLIAKRYGRGQNDNMFFGFVILAPLVIGFAVFGAFRLGLVAATAVKPMLAAAYVAFVAGWFSYWRLVLRHFRTTNPNATLRGPWDYSFDADGVGYKGETTTVRVTWRGVQWVEDLGVIVLFRCQNHFIFVPARMFADTTARKAFVATSVARVKAAAVYPKA
jgi:hypothetical protein